MPACFASLRQLESYSHILDDVLEHFLSPSFGPQRRSQRPRKSTVLAEYAHAFRGGTKTDAESELAHHMEHHVHMLACQSSAFFKQARLFRENVEIETDAIPGNDAITKFN